MIDRTWHVALFSMVPLVLLAPLILAWRRQALKWLAGWGVMALLFSVASPLVVAGLVFVPWLVRRALRRVTVDISLTFFSVLLLTVVIQAAVAFSWSAPPWALAVPMAILVASSAFMALVAARQLSPHA